MKQAGDVKDGPAAEPEGQERVGSAARGLAVGNPELQGREQLRLVPELGQMEKESISSTRQSEEEI